MATERPRIDPLRDKQRVLSNCLKGGPRPLGGMMGCGKALRCWTAHPQTVDLGTQDVAEGPSSSPLQRARVVLKTAAS
jgi:hypothetical protein